MIDTSTIQKLRRQTNAGIMDIKRALEEAGGDEAKALEILRKLGQKIAQKKQAERIARDGVIGSYIHPNEKVASLVMLVCETDFVARNEEFKQLAHDIAMQVAAMNPEYISSGEVPEDIINKEKEIYKNLPEVQGKPDEVVEKIIQGKLNKYFEDVCLLNQKFIKDDSKTIKNLIDEYIAKLGEKIEVKKIVRFAI